MRNVAGTDCTRAPIPRIAVVRVRRRSGRFAARPAVPLPWRLGSRAGAQVISQPAIFVCSLAAMEIAKTDAPEMLKKVKSSRSAQFCSGDCCIWLRKVSSEFWSNSK